MKTQVVLITLLFSLLSVQGFSATSEGEPNEKEKTTKVKYDYNLFKMFSINAVQSVKPDSTSVENVDVLYKREEN